MKKKNSMKKESLGERISVIVAVVGAGMLVSSSFYVFIKYFLLNNSFPFMVKMILSSLVLILIGYLIHVCFGDEDD